MHTLLRRAALLVVVTALAPACFTVEANLPGTLRNDVASEHIETVGKLEVEKTNWFFFWALVGDPPPDFFATEIQQQVKAKNGDGVAKLTYESQFGCVDLIVNGVTGGCIAPRTYKLSGDIVRLKAARLRGKVPAATDPKKKSDAGKVAQKF